MDPFTKHGNLPETLLLDQGVFCVGTVRLAVSEGTAPEADGAQTFVLCLDPRELVIAPVEEEARLDGAPDRN